MNEFAWLSRTELIVGREGLEKLASKHVLVVGLGGVGSFAAEFIARSGIGEMTIIDGDTVDISNVNRQLPPRSSMWVKPRQVGWRSACWPSTPSLSYRPSRNFWTLLR